MTPRTDRMRRRTHVDDEDLVGTTGAAAGAAAEGTAEVIVSVPLTIVDTPAETLPEDGGSVDGTATVAATTTTTTTDARDQATAAATHGQSISRTSTRSPTSATASTRVPTTSVLQRPSLNESRTLTLQDTNGLILQRQPTPAERRIQRQLNYLKKFMCVIATMPIIATLAVYNKIELVMWWEETDLARLSLAFAPTQSSTTRVPRHNQDNDDEPPPPPDYQSSIITPPAYIVAQQPRKVPSYRSLENLFAFARNGSRIFSRGTAADAAANDNNNTSTESGTGAAEGGEAGEGEEGQQHQEEGGANRGDPPTAGADAEHPEDDSNNSRSSHRSVVVQMPQEDSAEAAPQPSAQKTVHPCPEHRTEESVLPQEEKTGILTAATAATTTTPLTTITVVPRVEIEFVQPQPYLPPQAMPEMVEVGAGLGSHPTDLQHLHQYQYPYQGTRSFASTTSSSGGSSSTAHDTVHDLTLVDSFDTELPADRRPSLRTVTSLEGDWETDQDSCSAESSSLAHARHRSRDIKGKAPSRE
ncbi:hypothetical protein EC968_005563 [Mortierella alpina]|nr:hypothetical protein EC968_005563 [Mortierella alpina]